MKRDAAIIFFFSIIYWSSINKNQTLSSSWPKQRKRFSPASSLLVSWHNKLPFQIFRDFFCSPVFWFFFILFCWSSVYLQNPYWLEPFKRQGRCSWAFSRQLKKIMEMNLFLFLCTYLFKCLIWHWVQKKKPKPHWPCWKSAFHESTVHVHNVQIFPFVPRSQLDPRSPSTWSIIVVPCGMYFSAINGMWPMWDITKTQERTDTSLDDVPMSAPKYILISLLIYIFFFLQKWTLYFNSRDLSTLCFTFSSTCSLKNFLLKTSYINVYILQLCILRKIWWNTHFPLNHSRCHKSIQSKTEFPELGLWKCLICFHWI